MSKTKILHVTLILLAFPALCLSQSFNGRFSTAIYGWETQHDDSSSSGFFRGFQSADLDISGLGHPDVSVHTYFRTAYDFDSKTQSNPNNQVYNLYLQWKNIGTESNHLDLKLGRQQVFLGMRNPTIDGFRGDYTAKQFRLMGFVGSQQPLNGAIEPDTWDESHSYGGKLSTSALFDVNAAVSYLKKNREPIVTEFIRREPGATFFVQREDIEEEFLGFDASRRFGEDFRVYGHVEYDLDAEETKNISTDFQYYPMKNLYFGLEYVYRKPRVLSNSIFSAFDLDDNQEIWLRANYRYNHLWSFSGDYGHVIYSGSDAQRFGLGIGFWRTDWSYQRRMGYGGDLDAFSVGVYYPLTDQLRVNGSVSYASFKLSDVSDKDVIGDISSQRLEDRSYSIVALGRLNYSLMQSLNVDVEGQFLSQDIKNSTVFAGNEYDLRLFVRVNYWIFRKI